MEQANIKNLNIFQDKDFIYSVKTEKVHTIYEDYLSQSKGEYISNDAVRHEFVVPKVEVTIKSENDDLDRQDSVTTTDRINDTKTCVTKLPELVSVDCIKIEIDDINIVNVEDRTNDYKMHVNPSPEGCTDKDIKAESYVNIHDSKMTTDDDFKHLSMLTCKTGDLFITESRSVNEDSINEALTNTKVKSEFEFGGEDCSSGDSLPLSKKRQITNPSVTAVQGVRKMTRCSAQANIDILENREDNGSDVRVVRRGPGGPPPVAEAVQPSHRRGPSERLRKRKGRAEAKDERQEPRTINEPENRDPTQLPEGRILKTALHPQRKRVLQPCNPEQPSLSLVAPPSPAPLPTASSSIQHPQAPLTSHSRQYLQDKHSSFLINHGSDNDSDEGDDREDYIMVQIIPRVYWNLMETPFDDVDADKDGVGDSAPTGGNDPADVLRSMTEQPWDVNVFDWRVFPNPIQPELRREIFSQSNVGPTTPCTDPYEIFTAIWDRKILEHIALETNKYAQQVVSQMIKNNSLHPKSRISRWYDTTVDELYVYFGLILAMGNVVKTRVEEYWDSTPNILYTPGFSAHMPIDRFSLLSKCLHFNDNDDMCALELDVSEARLCKIQPILSHLNKKFESMYVPSQNISLDVSHSVSKGWRDKGTLVPHVVRKGGIKMYEICESQTGYLWRFEIHTHKQTRTQQINNPLEASKSAIVLQLIRGLEYKGYTLWMDSYHQSPSLARRLKSLGVDCVGTLRTDRRFVPQVLHDLAKTDMSLGQITGLTSGDVDVMVWRGAHRVAMISTYHGIGQTSVRGSTQPILISDYNTVVGGVDRKDQILARYPVERNHTKLWYKKMFRRLLNTSVFNSYVIHRHTSKISHHNFRISLITSLLSKHSSPSPISSAITNKQLNKVEITHYLDQFPMGTRQRHRRLCVVCKKKVYTFCVGCYKTVCMQQCFVTIHS